MKKIAIIGGGVAGLSAGICGQNAGYETTVYEKNSVTGGSCSGWYRNGFAIDNCLHWLTGTGEETLQYQLWRELGVIRDDTVIVKRPYFSSSETDNVRVTLWRDIDKTREELLKVSPEDELEINLFMDCVKVANDILTNRTELATVFKKVNETELVLSHFEFARRSVVYIGLTIEKWAEKFKHPAIRNLILDFCAKEYESYWLIVAYGFYVAGNADLIDGGSIKMANNLAEKYLSVGGTIETNMAAKQIDIKKTIPKLQGKTKIKTKHAQRIIFENGEIVSADYIICACDLNFTFNRLITGRKHRSPGMKDYFGNKKKYPLYSAFQVAFSVDGLMEEVEDSLGFKCNPIEIAMESFDRIMIRNYRIYGDYIAPEGKTVIQCMFVQYEKDFKYWRKLYKSDKERYKTTKINIANAILHEITERFPEYEGKIKVIDTWTPYTYARRNNDTNGAFMRYITTVLSRKAFIPQDVKGVDNVFLAGHWLRYPGGVPIAASTGKTAVNMIIEVDK